MLTINSAFFIPVLIFLFSEMCISDTTNEFSLRDAVALGLENNTIEVPLIRVSQKIAFCNYRASRSAFGTLDASGSITYDYDGPFSNDDTLLSPNSNGNLTSTSSLKSALTLPTGGTLITGISMPISQMLISDTPSSKIPLAGTLQLEQPLSPSIIKQKRFESFLEKEVPRRIKNRTRSELEQFIMQLASRYYQYSSLQNQLVRARKNAGQSRLDAEIAQLKFQNGAISQSGLVEIEAMREESELNTLTLESNLLTIRRDIEDLVGTTIDSLATFSGIDENDLKLPPKDSILVRALAQSDLLEALQDNVTVTQLRNRFSAIFSPSLKLSYTVFPKYGLFDMGYNTSYQIAAAGMDIPLISLREGRIALQKAQAEAQQAQLLFNQGHRQVSRTITDLYRSVMDLRIQIDLAKKNVIAARKSLDLAREQFVAGAISRANLDLYITKLESGERQYEESKAQLVIAHLEILQVQKLLLPFFGIEEEDL